MPRNPRDDDDDDTPRRGSGSGFRYQRRDPDEARKRTERNLSGIDSYLTDVCKIYKAPENDNMVRILPATWKSAKHYGVEVFIHYDVGPDGAAYLCLEKMRGKPCPICEERARAKSSGDDEYAQALRPNPRVFMYILDREKERDGVQVWSVGARMDNDIARLASDKRSGEYLEIDNPDKGYDLSFVRDGQGMKTRYTGFQIARRSSPLDNAKALAFAVEHPLIDQLVYYSYDHIKKVFAGGAGKDRDDDDDRPRRSRDADSDDPKPRRSRDEEEDKPRSRSRTTEVDLSWAEVHDLSFRKLSNLIEEHKLDIDVESTRNDEELADQICEKLDIEKPKRKRDDDDEPKQRGRASTDDDEVKPRRSRDEEEDVKPRGRKRDDEDPPFDADKPRRSRDADEDVKPRRTNDDESDGRRRLRAASRDED